MRHMPLIFHCVMTMSLRTNETLLMSYPTVKSFSTSHQHRSSNRSLPQTKASILKFLAWLPLAVLTACAVQPPALESPSASMPAQPETAAPTATAENAIAPAALPVSNDRIAALQSWVDQHNRLYRVAAPILLNNTELCEHQARNLLGLTAKTKYSYTQDLASTAHTGLGLGESLRVMNVLAGGGAAQAGIRKGDILLAIEDKPLPKGPQAERNSAPIVSAAMHGRPSVNLGILRDGKQSVVNVPLTRACAFSVELGDSDRINSYTDGRRVLITRGMLAFTQSDEELAYVLAKEIAHSILMPSGRRDMGMVIDRLRVMQKTPKDLSSTDTITPYSPVMDATADKLSLYLLARGGYDVEGALAFWKRLANKTPAQIKNGHTALHPSTNYRFSVMNAVIKTIQLKKANNQPLVP